MYCQCTAATCQYTGRNSTLRNLHLPPVCLPQKLWRPLHHTNWVPDSPRCISSLRLHLLCESQRRTLPAPGSCLKQQYRHTVVSKDTGSVLMCTFMYTVLDSARAHPQLCILHKPISNTLYGLCISTSQSATHFMVPQGFRPEQTMAAWGPETPTSHTHRRRCRLDANTSFCVLNSDSQHRLA